MRACDPPSPMASPPRAEARGSDRPPALTLRAFTIPVTFHGTAAALSPIEQVCAACGVGRCDPRHAAASSRVVLKFGFGLVESGRPTGLCASCTPCGTFPVGLLYTRGRPGGGSAWAGGAGRGERSRSVQVFGCSPTSALQPFNSGLPTPGAARSGEKGTGPWAVVDLGVCRVRGPVLPASHRRE